MRNPKIKVFYKDEQVLQTDNANTSKSPLKPKMLMKHLIEKGLFPENFEFEADWKPYEKEDFLLAHTENYVENFFEGKGNCQSNGLTWSAQFADSVRYTNASIYNAIKYANEHPHTVTFSPTSGFHHSKPTGGSGFCTFSGQVIAATKLYREKGLVGAFIDLDGHFGNSIEDSRKFVKDLNEAIPEDCNINPAGSHKSYLVSLDSQLELLEGKLIDGEVDYVVFCHGADSHEWDDLGHQCSTREWLKASRMVYNMIERVSEHQDTPVPLTLALFGGYRRDDYNSVLNLHTGDLVICLNVLLKKGVKFHVVVKRKKTYVPAYTVANESRTKTKTPFGDDAGFVNGKSSRKNKMWNVPEFQSHKFEEEGG